RGDVSNARTRRHVSDPPRCVDGRLRPGVGRVVRRGNAVAQHAHDPASVRRQQRETAIVVGAIDALEGVPEPGPVGEPRGGAIVAEVERDASGRAAGEWPIRPGLRAGKRSAVFAAGEGERNNDRGIQAAHGSGWNCTRKPRDKKPGDQYRCGVMPELRVLRPGDEVVLDAFLARHADSSMFLRSNARAAGLVDRGAPGQATYVAALERGEIVGVAAHCWNGMVLLQAPAHVAVLAREAGRRSGRAVAGFSGPWDQVVAARQALGLEDRGARKDSREDLYTLGLRQLVVPPALAAGQVRCRHPEPAELDLVVRWRVDFSVEALGATDAPALETACRADALLLQERGAGWLLLDGVTPVAYSAFNAMLPEIV